MNNEVLHIAAWSSDEKIIQLLNEITGAGKGISLEILNPDIYPYIQPVALYHLLVIDLDYTNSSLSEYLALLWDVIELRKTQVLFITNELNDFASAIDRKILYQVDIMVKPLKREMLEFRIRQCETKLLRDAVKLGTGADALLDQGLESSSSASNFDKLAYQLVQQLTENIRNRVKIEKSDQFFDQYAFDKLLDAIPNPIYIKDGGGRYLKVNKAFEDYLGVKNEDLKYKTIFDLVPVEQARVYQTLDQKTIKRKRTTIVNDTILVNGRQTRNVTVIRSPVALSATNGHHDSVLGMMLDVTEKKLAEKYLQIQHDLEYNAWLQGGLLKSLQYILKKLCEVSWVDGGGIYLFDANQKTLKLVCSRGLEPDFTSQVGEYDKNTNQTRLVLEGKPHFSLFSKLKTKLSSLAKIDPDEFKVSAILPLKHKKEVIGSLNIISKTATLLTYNDKVAIESIAAKMGSVIAYIKSQEEIAGHKQMLEQKVMERTGKLQQLNLELKREISYHKKTKEALNLSENLYKSIFNNANDSILLYDPRSKKVVDFNRKSHQNLGYNRKEFKALASMDFMIFESANERDLFFTRLESSAELNTNIKTRAKSGEIKYNLLNTNLINVNNVEYVIAVLHDVTELKEATTELLRSERKIRELQENVSIGMFRLDEKMNLIYLNPFAYKLLKIQTRDGFEKLRLANFNLGYGQYRKLARRLIKSRSIRNIKTMVDRFDGSSFFANINLNLSKDEVTGAKVVDGTIEDISAVKRAQEELKNANRQITQINKNLEERIKNALEKQKRNQAYIIQKSKLESLGELASGVAHEINQPLGVMSLAFENLQTRFFSGDTDNDYLLQKFKSIDENIERIRNIIEQVRTFSRDDPPLMIQKVYINNCVRNVLKLIGTQYENHGVNLQLNLNEEIGFTVGSRTRLEQVIMNLLSNSKYAVDEFADYFNSTNYQKQITIETGFINKNQVYLTIEDNGIGIEKENISRVFDPFYTTKPSWKGTGLGLSIVYGILNEMRAEIRVESELEKFTRFTIIFQMYPEKI